MITTTYYIISSVNKRQPYYSWLATVLVSLLFLPQWGVAQEGEQPPVSLGKNGQLVYQPDQLGNRIPDFSYCGYMAAEKPIPNVPIQVIVPLQQGDATTRIQAALDYVASLPANQLGIRGAVLLEKGRYEVAGNLKIQASGVILRGSGMGADGTVMVGTGKDRQTLITIAGKNDIKLGDSIKITNNYVPVNAVQVQVANGGNFKTGAHIMVQRPSTEAWIHALGMEEFGGETGWLGWKPGERDLYWDRTITAINGNTISIDAPITTALDSAYGGGTVAAYEWPGRIEQVGVENLRLESAFDENNPKDEAHRWMAITLENVTDAWVRQVVFEHFAGSAVMILPTGKRITVEDCKSLHPVSEIGGQRRYTFWTSGQQTLFQRLYAEDGYHDFAVGFRSSLNAFVQCESHLPHSFSGAIDSWASGALFDIVNVDGQTLSFLNRRQDAQGAGWTAANSVFWQCSAARIDCFRPPTAQNWAFGAWSEFSGDGYWYEPNSHINPRSLYYAQLADRLGQQTASRGQLIQIETEATSSPTINLANELTALATQPPPQLPDWIDAASQRKPIPTTAEHAKSIDEIGFQKTVAKKKSVKGMKIQHGLLVQNNQLLTGKYQDVPWWRGNVRYYDAAKAKPAITRYVPGRTGLGLTDNLEDVADWMQQENIVTLDHNYGLWYERRRDDHERVRRLNGEVWAPFYELPFARSGEGTAWDGLSQYDLTQYNRWYWMRLQQFADLADEKGLVLMHENYFQHNIIEAGAHWADFPWRSANNVNETGFPEPPPYAGDKRIFMAEQFYDISQPKRRQLHQAYINKCLENFADNANVIQLTGAEFTGPLHFMQFWIDTITEWEKETGRPETIGLSATKDVQDAILTDPNRVKTVDVIDIRYWHYRDDGSAYAPQGGQNLAPRQYARLTKPGKSSFAQVYRAVHEYRMQYPDKAVIYTSIGYGEYGWAVFMAGGSLPGIPKTDSDLLADAATMQPVNLPGKPKNQWAMSNNSKEFIIYSESQEPIKLDLSKATGEYEVRWINPEDGCRLPQSETVQGGKKIELKNPQSNPVLMWLVKSKTGI